MTKAILHKAKIRHVPQYCPVCEKGHVVDVISGSAISYRIKLLKPGLDEDAVIFVKCPKCKLQIGLKFE